tara:strand:- start:1031 stop:1576 length:546 start_codon:yes stop_codon:yes gene_type:complete
MNRNIAVCIPLNKSFLKETEKLYSQLEKKFNLSFMKNKLCRPHINLCAGHTNNLLELQKKISKIKIPKKNRKIIYLGLGMFIQKKPTFYLRFSSEDIFLKLRKKLLKYSDIWLKIEDTVNDNIWIPKSSIIHDEISIKDKNFINIIKYLDTWNFSQKSLLVNQISIIDYTDIEQEIISYKI